MGVTAGNQQAGDAPRPKPFRSRARKAAATGTFYGSGLCLLGAIGGDFHLILSIAAWFLLIWLSILVHEFGHALVAWACGWSIEVFVAGRFGFHLRNRDFALVPKARREEYAGFVVPVPRGAEVWTRHRAAMISAGGMIANMLVLVPALALAFWGPGREPDASWIPSLVGWAVALASLSFILGSDADMSSILSHLRGDGAEWRKWRALATLQTMTSDQTRLRDLPHWIVEESGLQASTGDDQQRAAHEAILVGMVLDSAPVDRPQARRMLEEFRDRHGDNEWLSSCDAYFTATWEREPARARARLWKGEKTPDLRALSAAAEAAVLVAEGDIDAGRALLAEMREAARRRALFRDRTFEDIERQVLALIP